ncbi:hypothetical protein F5Y15DRAFT_426463 [Xylariaceae sp. FL0016]|nr:hypothetical protein F5Y15DRAFT_426463 [Xylariaceae sp. FL0016]
MLFRSSMLAMLAAGSAMAHMNMKDPAPLEYKGNPNAKEPDIDYSITSPITAAQYPCKGYLKLMGTDEGASVKTYAPGEQSTMSVEGGASHNGGSCQLSLSYDKGTKFTVIKSFIGNCPTSGGGTFDFTIPDDAPEGDDVVFAWTWVNNTGNREFYMSCAVVSIKSGGAKREIPMKKRGTAFADRPEVFQANLGGKYCTKEGVDTVYPEPGPDVENTSSNPGPAILCDSGEDAPTGDASGSDSGSGATSAASAATTAAAATSAMYVSSSFFASSITPSTPSVATSVSATTTQASTPSDTLVVVPVTTQLPSDSSTVTTSQLTNSSSSPTGGVFLTQTATTAQATSAQATTAVPTTMVTATSVPVASSVATVPAGTSSASAPAGSSVAGQQTGSCSQDGAWNCIDGSNFQRCASGQWSAVIPMAAGTTCTVGVSENLSMTRRRDRVRRRAANGWEW